MGNDLHTYFTVNSVFFDPDIFGRFPALVMILVAVLRLYNRPRRERLLASVVLAVLWAGLVLTLSRSSLAALLVGMGVLAALRWKPSRALVVAIAVIALGAAVGLTVLDIVYVFNRSIGVLYVLDALIQACLVAAWVHGWRTGEKKLTQAATPPPAAPVASAPGATAPPLPAQPVPQI